MYFIRNILNFTYNAQLIMLSQSEFRIYDNKISNRIALSC